MPNNQTNQGEGDKAADRQYRKDTEEFVKSGKVPDAAEKAREAVESEERNAMHEAEKRGKEPARR